MCLWRSLPTYEWVGSRQLTKVPKEVKHFLVGQVQVSDFTSLMSVIWHRHDSGAIVARGATHGETNGDGPGIRGQRPSVRRRRSREPWTKTLCSGVTPHLLTKGLPWFVFKQPLMTFGWGGGRRTFDRGRVSWTTCTRETSLHLMRSAWEARGTNGRSEVLRGRTVPEDSTDVGKGDISGLFHLRWGET